MASRRDQLQSYQFMIHRVISAVVMRETDPAESPLRRGVGAMFAGLMIFVIVAAGFGVVGLITHTGDQKWQTDGTVVVEKETGAVYLYTDGVLHPMANYASALLASGNAAPTTSSVSRNSLGNVPRGDELGIPNAPDALPDSGKLIRSAWTACTVPVLDGAGHPATSTVLTVAAPPAGAQRLRADHALLVQVADEPTTYLIFQGYKYPINQPDVIGSLFGTDPQVVMVSPAWLNTLTRGQAISTITVPDSGRPSAAVPGRKNGDLLSSPLPNGKKVYYIVFGDGLATITALQRDIYIGHTGAKEISIPVSEGNLTHKSSQLAPPNNATDPGAQPPAATPTQTVPTSSQDPICTEADPQAASPGVWIGGSLGSGGSLTVQTTSTGTLLASRVQVPAGRGAVIRVVSSPTDTSQSYEVVTDLGVRYPVTSVAALAMLGYSTAKAVDVPTEFAHLVPAGPTLDPAAARVRIDISAHPNGP